MATVTLAELRTMVREHAAQETSAPSTSFVDDTELDARINEALAALRDLRIDLEGQEWAAKTDTLTTVSGTESYSLPADFETLLGVRAEVASDQYPLDPWDYAMLSDLNNVSDGSYPTHYRLKDTDGASIVLKPTPSAAITVYLDYVPSYTELTDDSDVTFAMPYGWWKWAVLYAAIDLLTKEMVDPSALQAKWMAEDQRIRRRAHRRDAGRAARVKRTRRDYERTRLLMHPRLWRSS